MNIFSCCRVYMLIKIKNARNFELNISDLVILSLQLISDRKFSVYFGFQCWKFPFLFFFFPLSFLFFSFSLTLLLKCTVVKSMQIFKLEPKFITLVVAINFKYFYYSESLLLAYFKMQNILRSFKFLI
jgi:hypothetical protein